MRHFQLEVAGGNHAPVLEPISDFTVDEGETFALP